jgi:hypothetical protein
MTRASVVSDEIAAAACWHLAARLLERPHASWRADVAALARETPDPVLRAVATAAADGSEGAYLAALGPGAPVSPREAGHAGLRDPGWILAELARCYQVFGYAPRVEDPLDHVAVEVGFVAYLHLKEALARGHGDDEAVAVTRAAREAFARDHLAPLAAGLARRLAEGAPPYLAAVADWLVARLPAVDVVTTASPDPFADGCGACNVGNLTTEPRSPTAP